MNSMCLIYYKVHQLGYGNCLVEGTYSVTPLFSVCAVWVLIPSYPLALATKIRHLYSSMKNTLAYGEVALHPNS